ncbi:MAG TPA: hypothetical protein VN665_04255 [Candidatus Paceibacterota bacterium]|nr:hypothetical protein [Candidatus Paceibacterota bacterium]
MLAGFYEGFRKWLAKYGLESYYVVLVLSYFLIVWVPEHLGVAVVIGSFLMAFAPFVLPVLLAIIFAAMWLDYKRQQDYWSTDHTVLEIRLPEEITQSPYAAELFFRVLYQTGEVDTELHKWRGKTSPWFSLEIVSTEGVVRFYIWTRSRYKEIIKSQMYAHYPTVQVAEVPDYTLNFPLDLEKMDVWGVEQSLQKPDPYPVMTYVDWGLDKADTKEEFKTDPLNSVLEFFGSIGPGEHLWSQIIIRGHTQKYVDEYHEELNITQWTKKELAKVGKDYQDTPEGKPNFVRAPEGTKEALKAMQRKEFKQMFDVGIRTLYLARLDSKKGRNAGIPTMFRSFEHGSAGRGLNGFKPIFYIGPFNWPWEDFLGIRKRGLKTKFYNGYVTRQYFYEPNADNFIFLNTEELASIWHLPGKVARTPTLARMPSRRSEAPANLPIGEGPVNLPI